MPNPSRCTSLLACAGLAALALGGCNQAPPAPSPPPPPPVPPLQVLAAGNAASPPSLTAVTNNNRVVIDSVQPLHPGARPAFQGLKLAQPGEQAADMLLGWQRSGGEVVLVPQPSAASGPEHRAVRIVTSDSTLENNDQVLLFARDVAFSLPDAGLQAIDGRVLTLIAAADASSVRVLGLGTGSLTLRRGQSVQLIAVKGLGIWQAFGKS